MSDLACYRQLITTLKEALIGDKTRNQPRKRAVQERASARLEARRSRNSIHLNREPSSENKNCDCVYEENADRYMDNICLASELALNWVQVALRSVGYADDSAAERLCLNAADHEIRDVRARDLEAESRQMFFPDAILS